MNRQQYQTLVDDFTDWTVTRIHDLAAEDHRPPLVVPLTVTFRPKAVRPDRVLPEFERLYVRVCRMLVSNPERPSKRRLLPFALAFRDDPSTRPDKHPDAYDVFFNHPSVAPHVHSMVVVHPDLADRFIEVAGDLEAVWKGIPRRTGDPVRLALRSGSPIGRPVYDNGSLRADLDFAERVRRAAAAGDWAAVRREARGWIDYSAKLMRRRDADTDGDLFTALPTEAGSPLTGRQALMAQGRRPCCAGCDCRWRLAQVRPSADAPRYPPSWLLN